MDCTCWRVSNGSHDYDEFSRNRSRCMSTRRTKEDLGLCLYYGQGFRCKTVGCVLCMAKDGNDGRSRAQFLLGRRAAMALERALASSRSIVDKVFAADREYIRCCSGIADPNAAMRELLLTTDLLITDSTVSEDRELPNPAQLAHGSGVPVLRLGRSLVGAPFSHVMVAWKDTAQARRADHEALPLLIRAESVSVVGAGDEVSANGSKQSRRTCAPTG